MELDPEMRETPEGSRPCRVVIRLKDGRAFSRRVDHPKGSPEVPLSSEDLRAKFVECAGRALKKDAVDQALEYLNCLEGLADLQPLFDLLIGEAT